MSIRSYGSILSVGLLLGLPSCLGITDDSLPLVDTGLTEQPAPGEICTVPGPSSISVRFEPNFVIVAPCQDGNPSCRSRVVNVVVDPDFCQATPLTFETSDANIAKAPTDTTVNLHKPVIPLEIKGGASTGSATVTVHVPRGDGTDATATLAVEVMSAEQVQCTGAMPNSTPLLQGGDTLRGTGGLVGASMGLPQGADKPNEGSFIWSVEPFAADIACGDGMTLSGYIPLGPAITFGPSTKTFQRDVPLSIPINPVLLPDKARWRHLQIAYSGPGFKTPRIVPVADPRIEKVDGQWAVTFKAPRLGTYQALVKGDAGTKTRKRRTTHRAVIGVSMGGGGTAIVGMRHHHLFDVLAPLGGPVDLTWLLYYVEQSALGGFRSIVKGTQLADIQLTATSCTQAADCQPDERCLGVLAGTPGKCVLMPMATDPFEHAMTFNHWWYEYPRTGNGGQFSRADYVQIFRDLALMFGNPNGDNLSQGAENLPAGVRPDDPSQIGDHTNGECKVWVDPIDGSPDEQKQQEIAQNCPIERCSHTLTLTNYYDDEYNPDGTFPVITVCDGASQIEQLSPYANTWHDGNNQFPLEVGLAVDYNGNGVRDELEPIIRAGHEPWQDVGVDGLPSELEPGYLPGVNDDPAGDDYNAQYNPSGTEKDHRYQVGEPFADHGLDGVMETAQQPATGWANPGDGYDVGEGDGQFTASRGLQRFWEYDPHGIVRRMTANVPGGELTNSALARIDLWTDGGTRDLFNFGVMAQHLVGTFVSRGRNVVYLNEFTQAPGLDPQHPEAYIPSHIVYEDLQGIVMQRYGKADPTPKDIEDGSGQHVGTGTEIVKRLQSALYFIGSRWQDPGLRIRVEDSNNKPAEGAVDCEVIGSCAFEFTSSLGRTAPVTVSLPPGYAHADLQKQHYPVIYMLHGYGQGPEDLAAAVVVLHNWMNSATDSMASRLTKAILVYVDGRCRQNADGTAECIRGTFYTDSVRQGGALDEQWWLELMAEIERRYRTMGESEVDWVE